MKFCCFPALMTVLALSLTTVSVRASVFTLGSAAGYAALGQAGVTNTGPSLIFGNVGGSIGTPAVTGFPPGVVVPPSSIFSGSSTVFTDASAAYMSAQGMAGAIDLTGTTLGAGIATNLAAGVYGFNSSAALTGTLVLDAGGLNTATWIFQIGSSLTTASASSVLIVNAGSSGPFTGGITWAVGSAATLGTTTAFQGTIISQAGSVLNTGATIVCGRIISLNAAVTLDSNNISMGNCTAAAGPGGPGGGTGGPGGIGEPGDPGGGGGGGVVGAVIPEPGTLALLASGLLAMLARRRTKSTKRES